MKTVVGIQESDSDEEVEEGARSDEEMEVDSNEDEWSTENLTIEEEPLRKHVC